MSILDAIRGNRGRNDGVFAAGDFKTALANLPSYEGELNDCKVDCERIRNLCEESLDAMSKVLADPSAEYFTNGAYDYQYLTVVRDAIQRIYDVFSQFGTVNLYICDCIATLQDVKLSLKANAR